MIIQKLSSEQLLLYWEDLKKLLKYSRTTGSNELLPDQFYEKKLRELENYLNEDKATLLAAIDNNAVVGFIWACEINRDYRKRFHILYFAVQIDRQNKGIGKALLMEAERQARDVGIFEIELNVHADNHYARQFYSGQGYQEERIALIKSMQ